MPPSLLGKRVSWGPGTPSSTPQVPPNDFLTEAFLAEHLPFSTPIARSLQIGAWGEAFGSTGSILPQQPRAKRSATRGDKRRNVGSVLVVDVVARALGGPVIDFDIRLPKRLFRIELRRPVIAIPVLEAPGTIRDRDIESESSQDQWVNAQGFMFKRGQTCHQG